MMGDGAGGFFFLFFFFFVSKMILGGHIGILCPRLRHCLSHFSRTHVGG